MDPHVYPLTLYYESACPACNAETTKLRLRDLHGLLRFEDVSKSTFVPPEGATTTDLLELIHARTADGNIVRGVEVFRLAYRAVGLGWVVAPTRWALLRALADRAYRSLAENRHRLSRSLVHVLFETVLRRAAEAAARKSRCAASCTHEVTP